MAEETIERTGASVISRQPSAIARVRLISLISGIYDGLVGIAMLVAQPVFAAIFSVPLPRPPIHADLNGVFLLAVAAGYAIPYRDPEHGRPYLWVMGPLLKGMGAAAFVLDFAFRHSPASFLLFAVSDGTLALLTLWVLLSTRAAFGNHESTKHAKTHEGR